MSDFWSNRPSQDAVLTLDVYKAALEKASILRNEPRRLVMHPERWKDYQRMERYFKWLNHLLRTSYKAWNTQKHDGRWSKRTKQRRYVQWCEKSAQIAARMELEI